MSAEPKYPLTISLNVLEHLGINLYSNVPAVLAETVANAWDADASTVHVNWEEDGAIVIQDDGIGMTLEDLVLRFLIVGYNRRHAQPGLTNKGRRPMGRKGIGKLSLFSIARVIDVETAKDGFKNAFRLDVEKIRDEIRRAGGAGIYNAEPRSTKSIDFTNGTRLTLRNLRRRQSIRTTTGLKRRVARRFSIIGAEQGFRVVVNEDEITPTDRDYYGKIRYIWTYGDQEHVMSQCNVEEHEDRTDYASPNGGLSVAGWLAAVRRVRDLKDEDGAGSDRGDNLNRIAIFVRGKLAQEDMLADLSERGVYASYLIGELHVDDFDQYDGPGTDTLEDDDATTSSRQRIVEDDERYRNLQDIVWRELKHIQKRWKELRSDEGVKTAMSIPAVKKWLSQLPSEPRKKARAWLGRLNRLRIEDVNEQKSLIKHAVLAFEFYRANEDLRQLEAVSDENLEATLEVFKSLDDVESSLYGQITRQRLRQIDVLRQKVDDNLIERDIQEFLFEHLWLLDPSWERVEGSEHMERRVSKLLEEVDAKLSEEEKRARFDIKYRKAAGKHIFIELKRPKRMVSTPQIIEQVRKYRSGMAKLLRAQGRSNEPMEFVVLLGREPSDWADDGGQDSSTRALDSYQSRIVFYEKLLDDAYNAYSAYVDQRRHKVYLEGVIKDIEDYDPLDPD